MFRCKLLRVFIFLSLILFFHINAFSQKDTSRNLTDTFLLKQKGWLGKLAKNLISEQPQLKPVKNDVRFKKYAGKIIRNIYAQQMQFGKTITDTSKTFTNKLTKLANKLHRNTRPMKVIKNLFFSEHDRVDPYVLADNERYLRDLTFLNDARIDIIPIKDNPDSVDIMVFTKDVFSLGLDIAALQPGYGDFAITEDNLRGSGNRISFRNFFDKNRANKYAPGGEFVYRNIHGSFIDGYLGFTKYGNAINGHKEEETYYGRLFKPLVNAYVQWTYELESSFHSTSNMYSNDSFYKSFERYQYADVDAWVGRNFGLPGLAKINEGKRMRGLLGLRFYNHNFDYIPQSYDTFYNWHYASVMAVLASFTVFRQDFYKASYIYGFGRPEDMPEGINASFSIGSTVKQDRHRLFAGLDFERNYFTHNDRYFDFVFRLGGYFYKSKVEDINLMTNILYLDRLKQMNRWKQRFSVETSIGKQFNVLLNEPFILRSIYALPEITGSNEGDFRATLKGETVFYSPWNWAGFKFAPFMFGNLTLFTPNYYVADRRNAFTSLGAGIRTRNESLIFGTLELRGYYFPQSDLYTSHLRVEFNSNIRFKYNTQFVKKPDFININ